MSEGTLLNRAESALVRGEPERIEALFEKRRQAPFVDDDEAFRWVLVLAGAGLDQALRDAADTLSPARRTSLITLGLSPSSPAIETEPELPTTDTEPDWTDPDLGAPREGAPDDRLVKTFLRWFGGRRDLYARQWYDRRRKRSGYRPVRQPLTENVALGHLDGRWTIGQYLLWPDASVSYGVLDLDLAQGVLDDLESAHGRGVTPLDCPALREYASRLLDVAERLGLTLWPEDSGGKGVHLWLLLGARRPARAIRLLLQQLVLGAGSQPAEVGLEIFPKQDRHGARGLSSLVKLPLGIHRATLRRCHLLDRNLAPVEPPLAALARLRPAGDEDVDMVLGRRVLPLPAPAAGVPRGDASPLRPSPTPRSLGEAMRAIEPGRSERDACEQMLAGCAVLRAVVRRAYEAHRLTADEARAVVYTLGLVGPTCQLAREILQVAQVSQKELDRVQAGLPTPMGCARLRRLDGDAAVHCTCFSGAEALPYATPALWAVGSRPPEPPKWAPFAPWLDGGPADVADPMEAVALWLRRIEQRLRAIEEARSAHDFRTPGAHGPTEECGPPEEEDSP